MVRFLDRFAQRGQLGRIKDRLRRIGLGRHQLVMNSAYMNGKVMSPLRRRSSAQEIMAFDAGRVGQAVVEIVKADHVDDIQNIAVVETLLTQRLDISLHSTVDGATVSFTA